MAPTHFVFNPGDRVTACKLPSAAPNVVTLQASRATCPECLRAHAEASRRRDPEAQRFIIRKAPSALVQQVREYGRARGLSTTEAAVELMAAGLASKVARAAGAAAVNAGLSPEERRRRSARMNEARWGQRTPAAATQD